MKRFFTIAILLLQMDFYRANAQIQTSQKDTTYTPHVRVGSTMATGMVGQGFMPSIIPPSPNMSSLGKFIEHPVNNYTGLPTISVPLYHIQHRDISIPLALNYHASGNKVESVASWVGLGWSMTVGSITRSVRGLPDDLYSIRKNILGGPSDCKSYTNAGYLYCAADINEMYNATNTDPDPFLNELREVGMGAKDGISDMYYFNFGKFSGHFIFGVDGEVAIIPQQDLVIIPSRQDNKEIIGFRVITPDGIQYFFEAAERSVVTSMGYSSPFNGPGGIEAELAYSGPFFNLSGNGSETADLCSVGGSRIAYNSAWHLTKILSAKSSEEVTFSYRDEKSHVQSYSGESLFWWDRTRDDTAFRTKSAVSNYTQTKIIESITWPAGNIQFKVDLTAPRQDTDRSYTGHKGTTTPTIYNYALDKIEVYETGGAKIKAFNFSYSYFESTTLPDFSDNNGTDYSYYKSAMSKRLKLESITESGANPYLFKYNTTALPHRASTQQDFWGYYKPNNSTSLIPIQYEYPSDPVSGTSFHTSSFSIYPREKYNRTEYVHYQGGWDRSADSFTSKAGVLTEVIYPTKGGTLFTYSLNEFYIDGQKVTGGGLRISEIRISKDATYTRADDIVKSYDYHNSGQIVDLPVFGAYGLKGDRGVMVYGSWSAGLALTQGSYVGYAQVSESITDNGKNVFKYKTPAMYGTVSEGLYTRPTIEKKYLTLGAHYGNNNISGCSLWITDEPKVDYFPRPFAPGYEWSRGLLVETETWNQSGNLIKKVENNYTIKSHIKIPNVQVAVLHVDDYAAPELGQNDCFRGRHCYNFSRTYDISPWIVLDKTTEHLYNDNNTPVTKIEEYTFASANHKQITQKRVTQSDASILETNYKYSKDYNVAYIELGMMKESNMIDPTEQTTILEKSGTDRKVVDATVTTYKSFTGNSVKPVLYLPYKQFKYNGLDGSIASFAAYDATSNETASASYRETLKYTDYDTQGNPLGLLLNEGEKLSYLWSYKGQYPVAQIQNADNAQVLSALGGTTFAQMADMTDSPSIKSKLDAVRNALPEALVTSYLYKPLVGTSNIIDPAGKDIAYEYDELGRLKTIKNNPGNTRASFCYNYAGQVVNCASVVPIGSRIPPELKLLANQLVPNLSPAISILPAAVIGPTQLYAIVNVSEFNDVPTSGLIKLYISRDGFCPLSFDPTATVVGGQAVSNASWTLDNSNPSFYILTTNQVIPASGSLSVGMSGILNPGAQTGETTVTVIIDSGSGGEVDDNDNSDDERIFYSF